MSKKIIIDKRKCIACGLCTASPYIEELSDGKAQPKGTGILPFNQEAAFKEIIEICPENAITLQEAVLRSQDEIINLMHKKISEFTLPMPKEKDFNFEDKYINIHIPCVLDCYPKYPTYQKAKSAAKEAIDRAMFSQRKSIVQDIINNYRIDKLSPYYDYAESENNFFYSANKKAQSLLKEFISEIQANNPDITIPDYLLTFQSRSPSTKKSYEMMWIKELILDQAEPIVNELSASCYSLSSYTDYCDIDDSEEPDGTNFFGDTKWKRKYGYSNVSSALEKIANNIKSACHEADRGRIVEPAYTNVKRIIEEYTKTLQKELQDKADQLTQIMREGNLRSSYTPPQPQKSDTGNFIDRDKTIYLGEQQQTVHSPKEKDWEEFAENASHMIQKLAAQIADKPVNLNEQETAREEELQHLVKNAQNAVKKLIEEINNKP